MLVIICFGCRTTGACHVIREQTPCPPTYTDSCLRTPTAAGGHAGAALGACGRVQGYTVQRIMASLPCLALPRLALPCL